MDASKTFTTPAEDGTLDVSDAWQERFDPENKHGTACLALFRHFDIEIDDVDPDRPSLRGIDACLIGLEVQCGGHDRRSVYVPRALAIEFFGHKFVADAEDTHSSDYNEIILAGEAA